MRKCQMLIRHLFMLLALLLLASCASGPTNLVGLGAVEHPLIATNGVKVHKIFVATSRLRSENAAEFFSGERSQVMGLGNVNVTIPPNHKLGQIEQPSSGKSDIATHFTIAQPVIYANSAAFETNINKALASRPEGERSILVFVHGYNTNFSSAVLRMTQFVNDTGFQGVPVLFTWASRGRALDYVYDINSALQARFYLMELASILTATKAESFSVVAHSMGNLVTLEAMTALVKHDPAPKAQLNSVILAAPDVDFDLFEEYIKDLGPIKDKIYVLVSKDDRALTLSRRLAGGVSRVGTADPEKLAALGLKVVDLSLVDDKSNTNHSKFADSPEIVQLIGTGINQGNSLSTENYSPSVIGSLVQGFSDVATDIGGVLTIDE